MAEVLQVIWALALAAGIMAAMIAAFCLAANAVNRWTKRLEEAGWWEKRSPEPSNVEYVYTVFGETVSALKDLERALRNYWRDFCTTCEYPSLCDTACPLHSAARRIWDEAGWFLARPQEDEKPKRRKKAPPPPVAIEFRAWEHPPIPLLKGRSIEELQSILSKACSTCSEAVCEDGVCHTKREVEIKTEYRMEEAKGKLRCSVCYRFYHPQNERPMVAGPEGIFICSVCVKECNELFDEDLAYLKLRYKGSSDEELFAKRYYYRILRKRPRPPGGEKIPSFKEFFASGVPEDEVFKVCHFCGEASFTTIRAGDINLCLACARRCKEILEENA